MNTDRLYETETMAELCARQGRIGEAIAIYRELFATVTDDAPRARYEARLAELTSSWHPLRESELPPAEIPLPTPPGTAVEINDDHLTIAWALLAESSNMALDILVLQRSSNGIEVQKKLVPLSASTGRLGYSVPGLHSAVAAAGSLREGRFIPLAFPSTAKVSS